MYTYKATNTLNGKFYIGSTTNFNRRKNQHLNSKDNYPFQSALRKNPGAFEWEVEEDNFDEPILEQALLEMWFGTEQCYNLNPDAARPPDCTGRIVTEKTKQKLREANVGEKNPNHGKKASEETRQKLREANSGENNPFYGKSHTEESKRKNREAHTGENNACFGKRGELSPQFGKKHTEETKHKMSESRRGEKHWSFGKSAPLETRKKQSEAKVGRKWWVNEEGESRMEKESPGPEWRRGRS